MKKIILLAFFISNVSWSMHIPCDGLPGATHINPDSSTGGFVAATATVDPTVYIASEASVCERAIVIEGAKVLDKAIISGTATVRGNDSWWLGKSIW